jgi:glycosyltransferase involved in cell wall biosynthesis
MVCLDTYPVFNPEIKAPFGGAQTMAYMLAKGFARKKQCESSFLVYDYGQRKRERREGVMLYRSPDKRLTKYFKILTAFSRRVEDRFSATIKGDNMLSYYRNTARDIFLKINPEMTLLFGVSDANYKIALLLKSLEIPWTIMLAHDEDVSSSYYPGTTFRNRHDQPGEDCFKLIEMTDRFVAQNEFQLRSLEYYFGKLGILIQTPIEVSGQEVSTRENILWVGRATDVKRPELFIEMAINSPNESFVMVTNDGDQERFNRLKQMSPANLKIFKNIPFHQIDEFFSRAKLLVNTSISEGFPVTFLHAGKYGVPVYTLGVDPNGLLTEKKCGKVLRNISELPFMLQPEELQVLGANLKDTVLEIHDADVVTSHLLAYLQSFKS